MNTSSTNLPTATLDNGFTPLTNAQAVFCLGTDIYIGTGDTCERRVGITSNQAGELMEWLKSLGIDPVFYVVKGAGERAGYPDEDYEKVGCTIVSEDELSQLSPAPHVVHALKESTDYESLIAGPFARIGALHTGDFHPEAGWVKLMHKGQAQAYFDGSNIGCYAYQIDTEIKPKFSIPLRSSMSQYAGWLAAEDVGQSLQGTQQKVVISGGGVVGSSSVDRLLEKYSKHLGEIIIIEKFQARCEQLKVQYAKDPLVTIKQGSEVDENSIDGAAGLILTIFIPGMSATDKVVDLSKIARMQRSACIVDVACDEGGAIALEAGEKISRSIEEVRQHVDALHMDLKYEADNHMPRRDPWAASNEHGRTVLMYLATLLYLAAREGGTEGMLHAILNQDYGFKAKNIMQALSLDLKHGLAFTRTHNTVVCYRHVVKRSDELCEFWQNQGIQTVFA